MSLYEKKVINLTGVGDLFMLHYLCLNMSSQGLSCEEVKIPVPWGHVAGKWWGSRKIPPILITHGWQDNCGSFDRLIPLLPKEFSYLAIDFPGHGLSSQLPQGIYYHSMNNVLLLKRLMKHFKWNKIYLMGHSYGAAINFVFAMLFPDSVEFLICLDALTPTGYPVMSDPCSFISRHLNAFLEYDSVNDLKEEPPSYSKEVLVQKLLKSRGRSIAPDSCHHVLQRDIEQLGKNPEKFYFKQDPRLMAMFLFFIAPEHVTEGTKRIKCPVFACSMTGATYFDENYFTKTCNIINENNGGRCEYYRIEGSHHVHLNEPEKLAGLINEFLKKYHPQENFTTELKASL